MTSARSRHTNDQLRHRVVARPRSGHRAVLLRAGLRRIQQAFAPEGRARAIAVLTLAAGLSGPIFLPATGALVDELGWRATTRVLAAVSLAIVPLALAWTRTRPAESVHARPRLDLAPFRRPRLLLFTVASMLAYGSVEAIIIHRVARFEESASRSAPLPCGPASLSLARESLACAEDPRSAPAARERPGNRPDRGHR
jgi:MFS family permease